MLVHICAGPHLLEQGSCDAQTIVEDKNTKARAAPAGARGCVLGKTEPTCMQPSRISNSRASCLA